MTFDSHFFMLLRTAKEAKLKLRRESEVCFRVESRTQDIEHYVTPQGSCSCDYYTFHKVCPHGALVVDHLNWSDPDFNFLWKQDLMRESLRRSQPSRFVPRGRIEIRDEYFDIVPF